MKELDDLLHEHAETPIQTFWMPDRVLQIVRPENVDEVMRALPSEFREVIVGYVQETYASGARLVRFGVIEHPERIDALREWVRREGRYHWPRHPDEPSLDEIRARLDPPPFGETLKREPFRILRYVKPDNVDKVLANLDADVRDVVVEWANEALAGDGAVTGWRMRPGAVDAMRDWLRRHRAP